MINMGIFDMLPLFNVFKAPSDNTSWWMSYLCEEQDSFSAQTSIFFFYVEGLCLTPPSLLAVSRE